MAKKPVPKSQSAEVYAHLQSRGPRDMGRTADDERQTIPSSTYRSLESTIPADSLRMRERYVGYNPKTGKSKYVDELMDVMDEAREHINCGKFHTVTTGVQQRREKRDQQDGDAGVRLGGTRSYNEAACPSPSLSGDMKRKRRY